jgi:hypothetical protein
MLRRKLSLPFSCSKNNPSKKGIECAGPPIRAYFPEIGGELIASIFRVEE